MNNLPNFPSFEVEADKTNAGTRWEKWMGRLENLFVGMKITDADQKRALLLHYAGEKVYDIYDAEKKATEATYDATKKVLNDYFAPKKNVQMEIYTFRSCRQKEEQTLDEFVTELRTLSKNCGFTDVDKEILQQVIQNCKSNQLRRRALREPDKSLNDILTLGRMLEQSERQAVAMENSERSVQKVTKSRASARGWRGGRRNRPPLYKNTMPNKESSRGKVSRDDATTNRCRNCGFEFPHRNAPCPAKGKTCNLCKRANHFSRCCRQREKRRDIREVSDENLQSGSEEEFNFHIEVKSITHSKTPKTVVKINDVRIKVTIDTGSSVNIIDEAAYGNLGKPRLNTKKLPKLLPYGGGPMLKVKGCCEMTIENQSTESTVGSATDIK